VVLAKIMPIANVNRMPIAVWHIFFHNSNKFCRFLLGKEIRSA